MSSLNHMKVALVLFVLTGFLFLGCSADTEAESPGFIQQVVDSITLAVAENLIPDTEATPTAELAVAVEEPDSGMLPAADMLLDSTTAHATFGGGLLIYDLASHEGTVAPVDDDLRALAKHAGDIFVGGDCLYRLDGTELIPVDGDFAGRINVLCSYGPSLMIGTTSGLYARNILGNISLLDGIEVSALVADDGGLWIGSNGQGLLRWDGQRFKQRYLARDRSLFDNVTALAFNHNRLYVGTTNGLFVFDGGRWTTVTADDGLPCDRITSIDATGWVVYVGTSEGLVSYFNNEVLPVDRLGGYPTTVVRAAGRKIVAATANDGLILKDGPAVKTLVGPSRQNDSLLAFIAH